MVILKVFNVVKRFGGLVALDDVSLSVDKGEVLGLIGPNGSGKTTLFNVVSGYYLPDRGKVYFSGIDVTEVPPHERAHMGIARTFQIPRPFHGLSVRENVAIGAMFGSLHGKVSVREALEIADQVLRDVGLFNKRFEDAARLTMVEKRLLELARALAMKPRLLLLDEVTAGLTPMETERVIGIVKGLREEGISVVMVEHVLGTVAKVADKVVVLNRGKKIAEGNVGEVMRNEEVVKAYIGEGLGLGESRA